MTYRELLVALSEEQLDCKIKVEYAYLNECREGELKICNDNHPRLADNYPIIFIP